MFKAIKAIFGAIEESAFAVREGAALGHDTMRIAREAVNKYGDHLLNNLDDHIDNIEVIEENPVVQYRETRKERLIN